MDRPDTTPRGVLVDLEVPSTRRTINKPLIGDSRTNWSVAGNLLPFALRGQRYINSEMNKHRDEILIIGNPFDVCLFLQIMNALRAVCRLPGVSNGRVTVKLAGCW